MLVPLPFEAKFSLPGLARACSTRSLTLLNGVFGEPGREQARAEVGDAARREGDDHAQRLRRVLRENGGREQQRRERSAASHSHAACFAAGRGLFSRGSTSFATRVIWSIASAWVRCPAWPIIRKFPRPPMLSMN